MERPITPEDPLFKLFYYLGYLAIFVVVMAGGVITYDWWKEKKEKEREEGENG